MGDHGLLEPGSARAAGATGDAALVDAMLRVEVAWLRALASLGVVDQRQSEAVGAAVAEWVVDLSALGEATEAAGNPVVPLVAALRARVDDRSASGLVHRGLTSQDVLDTALVLLARDVMARVSADLDAIATTLGALADKHRRTVMVGRTLTQHAVPITFGLKAAQWLSAVLDAAEQVDTVARRLPVQCGGAAGTLALVAEHAPDPVAAARAFAGELMLDWPGAPWHTNRAPVTRVVDALVSACDALGVIASNVVLLGRPEIAELREGSVTGRGGSSTMPHKQNPVLGVLVRSASLQAPSLGAAVHAAAAQFVDERPDGAWHAEWPPLRRLLTLTVTAASQAAELVAGLEVDVEAMEVRARASADALLAERGSGERDPATYLGAADVLIDSVLSRLPDGGPTHG